MTFRSISESSWIHTFGHPALATDFSRAGAAVSTHWGWPHRRKPFHICYFVLQGRCRGLIQGKPFQLEPGSFLWLQPDVPHEVEQDPDTPLFRHLHLTFDIRLAHEGFRLKTPALILKNAEDLHAPFQALVDEIKLDESMTLPSPFHRPRLRALAMLFFIAVFEQPGPGNDPARKLTRRQCLRLQEVVTANPTHRFTPGELAGLLGLSSRYFTLLFSRTFGIPPREWLLRQRIHQAAELVHDSPLTFSEIAFRFGYADLFLFSRQFKQVMGESPRSYRRRV